LAETAADIVGCQVFENYDEAVCLEAARLHHDALSYRSFITAFGLEFLKEIYLSR